MQGLADGYYGGLCLYETPYNFGSSTYSNAYMRMSGTDTKADRRRRNEVFLCMLEEQEGCIAFDPYTFVALVDRVIVDQNRMLEFCFRNGMKYEYRLDC